MQQQSEAYPGLFRPGCKQCYMQTSEQSMKSQFKHLRKYRFNAVARAHELFIGQAKVTLDVSLLLDRFISVQFGEGESVTLKAGQLLSFENWAFCIGQTSIYIPEDARAELNTVLRAIWRDNPVDVLF
jgi:hypothetical protein